jgi:hypothetical protein
MRTCTCPHEATRNGFMRTGYNSLCPFHGKPLPEVAVRPMPEPGDLPAPWCPDCGRLHDGRCEYVDET